MGLLFKTKSYKNCFCFWHIPLLGCCCLLLIDKWRGSYAVLFCILIFVFFIEFGLYCIVRSYFFKHKTSACALIRIHFWVLKARSKKYTQTSACHLTEKCYIYWMSQMWESISGSSNLEPTSLSPYNLGFTHATGILDILGRCNWYLMFCYSFHPVQTYLLNAETE